MPWSNWRWGENIDVLFGFGSPAELTIAGVTKSISEPEDLISLLN